jgi:hypothetical protein
VIQQMLPAPMLPPGGQVPHTEQPDHPEPAETADWVTLLRNHSFVHSRWTVQQADHHRQFLEMRARSLASVLPWNSGRGAPRMTNEQMRAFGAGRLADCFGPGFELLSTHTRSPGIPHDLPVLFDEVTDLDHAGGPHGRGYLRATRSLTSTVAPPSEGSMLEGGLQAMALFIIALGQTCAVRGARAGLRATRS